MGENGYYLRVGMVRSVLPMPNLCLAGGASMSTRQRAATYCRFGAKKRIIRTAVACESFSLSSFSGCENRTKFIYGSAQIIADVDSTGGLIRAYTWGPGIDNLLAMTVYTGATVLVTR
jgi:hypothetical protein